MSKIHKNPMRIYEPQRRCESTNNMRIYKPAAGLRLWQDFSSFVRFASHLPDSHRGRGFTIVETLIAIAVLLLSATAPLSLAERSLASAQAAEQEVTAFYLAQEAIEFVRNLRDENALAGRGGTEWLRGLSECLRSEGCGIDPTAPSGSRIVQCSSANDNCALFQYTGAVNDRLRGLYGHRQTSGWSRSALARRVFIREITRDVEAEVLVRMEWTAGALGERSIEVRGNFLNWYAAP